MAANTIASLLVKLGLSTEGFGKGILAAEQSVMGFGKSAGIGIGLAAGAVAGGLLSTLGAAREWETAFAGVRKTLDTTGLTAEEEAEAFGTLEKGLLDLSRTIPVASTELAGLAEAAGALGIARGDIMEFVRVTALIGVTTDVSSEQAATSLGKLGNVLRLTVDDYDNFASALVALGNKGASFESEILETVNRIAGSAATFGLSTDQVLGWGAAIANVGILPEAAGASFQRFAKSILDWTEEGGIGLTRMAEVAGMTEQAFGDLFSRDVSAAMEAIIVGLSKLDAAGLTEFLSQIKLKGTRDFDFIAKLVAGVGQEQKDLSATLDQSMRSLADNSALMAEAERRFETLDSGMQLFWNSVNVLAITLGKTLVPIMRVVVEHASNLVGGITGLLEAFPALTAVVTPLVTALSGLVALKVGAGIAGMLLPMRQISAAFNALAGAIPRLMAPVIAKMGAALAGTQLGANIAAGLAGTSMMGRLKGIGGKWGTWVGGAMAIAMVPLVLDVLDSIQRTQAAIPGLQASIEESTAKRRQGDFTVAELKAQYEALAETRRQLLAGEKGFLADIQFSIDAGGVRSTLDAQMADIERQIARQLQQQRGHARAGVAEVVDEVRQGYDPLSSIRVPKVPAPEPDTGGVQKSFAEMRKAILQGFGSVKAALKDPPQIISRADRIENMEGRLKKVMRNLHKAVAADDPINTSYWTKAAAKQAAQLDRMRGKGTTTTGQIKRKFEAMGVDIDAAWQETSKAARRESEESKVAAVGAARETVRAIEGMDLTSAGTNLMVTWANGIRAGISSAVAAATEAARAVAAVTVGTSPPPKGPLSGIDRGGENVVRAWAGGLLKGVASVRAASGAAAGAFSPAPAYGASLAMAGMGGGMGGGDVHIHVGTLIADDRGIDELERRMGRRRDMRDRKRRRDFETPTGRIGQNGRG